MKHKWKLITVFAMEFLAVVVILLLVFFAGKKSYTVTFDLNGGTLLGGDLVQKVTQGGTANAPRVTKDGCYLLRWSASYNKVTKDVYTIAIWEYETTEGIEYSESENKNYTEITGSFEGLSGDVYIGAYHDEKKILAILDNAFKGRNKIKQMHLLDGIINIGRSVFEDCTNLESIEMPATVISLGDRAFAGCEKIETIILPDGLEYIGAGAFENCKSLAAIVIPSTVKYIGEGAFRGCESLESVVLSEGVLEIGAGAFADCKGLSEITLPTSVTTSGAAAFKNENIVVKVPEYEGEEPPPGFDAEWAEGATIERYQPPTDEKVESEDEAEKEK